MESGESKVRTHVSQLSHIHYRESREKSLPALSRSMDKSGSPGRRSSSDLGMKARSWSTECNIPGGIVSKVPLSDHLSYNISCAPDYMI